MVNERTTSPAFYEERIRLLQKEYRYWQQRAHASERECDQAEAGNQRLRDALERIGDLAGAAPLVNDARVMHAFAEILLAVATVGDEVDGTPSAAQTLEDPQKTKGTGSSSDGSSLSQSH